jgi:hypothetical protein
MAEQHARYEASFEALSASPQETRILLNYAPKRGRTGPSFQHELTLTPEQVQCRLTAKGVEELGVTWPLLEDDGRALEVSLAEREASVRYPNGADVQRYSAPQPGARLVREEVRIQSTCGWLRPVRVVAVAGEQITVIQPHRARRG